jgi:hypothetical protein
MDGYRPTSDLSSIAMFRRGGRECGLGACCWALQSCGRRMASVMMLRDATARQGRAGMAHHNACPPHEINSASSHKYAQ